MSHFPAFRTTLGFAIVLAPLLTMTGCSGSSMSTENATSGVAYLGKLANSNVAVYSVGPNGAVSATPMMVTGTGTSGTFRVPKGPLLVDVSGGTYREEATNSPIGFQGNSLRAAYLSPPSLLVVSPFTEAIVTQALTKGGLTADNLSAATEDVATFLGISNPIETEPALVASGTTVSAPTDANWMAFALGTESQMRHDYKIDHASAVAAIIAQAANGDTMANCNQGAGNVSADGTLLAPQGDNCAFTMSAAKYAANPLNTSGITAVPVKVPTEAVPTQYATATISSCADRVALLEANRALFDGRKNAVQADLTSFVTASNWSTAHVKSSWGPLKAAYGAITAPAVCNDPNTFRRELILAIENYWIDQGVNYCHHHIPGWLPPDDSQKGVKAKYRNSNGHDTSGGSADDMTCTDSRNSKGEQIVPGSAVTHYDAQSINWYGVDCSDFTSWIYDFAGMTRTALETAIGAQACSIDRDGGSPGVLLDINSNNVNDLVGLLKPGDLLLITQVAPSATDSKSFKEAHVVTWTGKRWSDLQKGADQDKYDLAHLGQAGSRLGGDIASYIGSFGSKGASAGEKLAKLGTEAKYDPWMIIDSHYAGPAYRPFIMSDPANGITADWYASSLSAVRRIIGADEAKVDPSLAAYVVKSVGSDDQGRSVLASTISGATVSSGNRLLFDTNDGNKCYRLLSSK